MVETFSGILIDVRLLQPSNAPSAMLVMEFGMLIEVSRVQPRNAFSGMLVLPSGMVTLEAQLSVRM